MDEHFANFRQTMQVGLTRILTRRVFLPPEKGVGMVLFGPRYRVNFWEDQKGEQITRYKIQRAYLRYFIEQAFLSFEKKPLVFMQ